MYVNYTGAANTTIRRRYNRLRESNGRRAAHAINAETTNFMLTKVRWLRARAGIRLHACSLNSKLHEACAVQATHAHCTMHSSTTDAHTRDVIRDFPSAQALTSARPLIGAAFVRNKKNQYFTICVQ